MIDTLRYDRLGVSGYRPDVTPTLNWIARNGIQFTRMFAQGPATQMVFPCIHSSTYPLDYNGYNDGLKHRPWSAAEVLKANGYKTYAYMGMPMGRYYNAERGFDRFLNFGDLRNLINNIIKRDFLHYYRLLKPNLMDIEGAFEILKSRADVMFDAIVRDFDSIQDQSHYAFIRRHNRRFLKKFLRERELFCKNPRMTIQKIINLGPDHFLNFLGVEKISRLLHLYYRSLNYAFYASNSFLRKTTGFSMHRRLNAYSDVLHGNLRRFLDGDVKEPFFIYIHYCDLHDGPKLYDRTDVRQMIRGGGGFLREYPWGSYQGDYIYDIALGALDREIESFISFLKTSGRLKDSILVVNSDHGDGRETSFPWRRPTLVGRFHREWLHIPFVIYHEGVKPRVIDKLCGQADVFPTLFDMIDVESPKEFMGRPMLRDQREYVICEAGDSGNCDLSRRVLSFTLIDDQFKLMTLLKGNSLEASAFYDLVNDPWEMNNVVSDERFRAPIDQRKKVIYEERVKPIRAEHPFLGLVEA